MSVHQSLVRFANFPGYSGFKAPAAGVHHVKGFISKGMASQPRLLFVTDYGLGAVYIYSLPKLALMGTITGLSGPQGGCSGKKGNVWITNTNTKQIFEYSRAGTLVNTLTDSAGLPVGCAYDKKTGNLAVSNILSASYGAGNVVVYANATGSGTTLSNPAQEEDFFPTYDTSGNLYVDGTSTTGSFILSECASGSSSCTTMSISGASPTFPGGLNWNKKTSSIVIGDQECSQGSCQYTGTVSGDTVTVTSTTALLSSTGGTCDVDQAALGPDGKFIAGGCFSYPSAAARWAMPAGG
ncbi:MAG TPA: hypothetical protein VHS56_10900, partial [Candidatus Cybelea sp.]|nr:hypothetical protein [Candidatus Cybelea sp.]